MREGRHLRVAIAMSIEITRYIKLNHLRSSTMTFEIGLPETFTRRTRFRGFWVGNVTVPRAASLASLTPRLAALLARLSCFTPAVLIKTSSR